MVIATSDSCNTLVSLDPANENKLITSEQGDAESSSYRRTEIHLPTDDFDYDEDETSTTAQNIEDRIYLPTSDRVDQFLKNIPQVVEACDELLANPPRQFTKNSTERVLYVAQGEVAHANQMQCDVLVSDKATTCHILALRSESGSRVPISSLTHIDGPTYESCIRSMVDEHIAHHGKVVAPSDGEEKKEDDAFIAKNGDDDRITMEVHVVGGFEDDDSTSSKLSNWLMNLLADIASEQQFNLKMILKTCAITSMNDNGHACPIGRGLGINLRSGETFLAKVDEDAVGPVAQLRSVRLWSSPNSLSVIHTSTSNELRVNPFVFKSFPEANQLLQLPDHVMIQFTSTSPDVEEDDFCDSIRASLQFLLTVECTSVFGSSVDQPIVFKRSGFSNSWKRIR